jgi:hypothetical protein
MKLVAFRTTNNQVVYVNPAQVIYVTVFEPDVSVIAFAAAASNGNPMVMHVRGGAEQVQAKLCGLASA